VPTPTQLSILLKWGGRKVRVHWEKKKELQKEKKKTTDSKAEKREGNFGKEAEGWLTEGS